MDRVKLLQNPLPINRVAARVIKPAKDHELWRPAVNTNGGQHAFSPEVLRIQPIPAAAIKGEPRLAELPGKRRSRMTVIGYGMPPASDSGSKARWVVRCDCGNYEHRTSIFRWLGTAAPDACMECRVRHYKTKGEFSSRNPAKRDTVEQTKTAQA